MLNEKNTHLVIKFLVFLFPILTATVKSAGGVIVFIFVLSGFFKGWSAWKNIEYWEKKILVGFILFCILVSLSLVGTQDMDEGFRKLNRYLYFVLFIPAYLFIRHLRIEIGKSLFFGAVVGSFVMLLQALYQHTVLGYEFSEGAYHKIIFGDASMMIAVIVTLGLIAFQLKSWQYAIGVLAVAAGLGASILSGSRGAWIFFPVSVLTIIFLYRNYFGKKVWCVVAGLGVVLFIFSFVWLPDKVVQGVKQIETEVAYYKINPKYHLSSYGVRINLWRDSLEIWKDFPVLGTGIGDFDDEINKRMVEKTAYSFAPRGHAHSIYFDALATAGIIGLVGMLFFMLLRPFRYYVFWWPRAENQLQRFYLSGGMLVIIGFSVFGLTEGWLSRSSMVIQYLMYTLVFMSSFAINKNMEKSCSES